VLRRRKFARLITTERRSPCARSCAPWWRARTRCPPGASGGCSRRPPDAGRRRAARPEEEVDVPAARKRCFATRRCGRLGGRGGVVGVGVGGASVSQAARGRGFGRGGALAVAVGVVFLALASRGAGVPRINDFTTDPTDPPAFTHAVTLPPNVGRDMSYPKAF